MTGKMNISILHSTWIAVSPSRVYKTLTTAKGWDAWFTSGTTLDLEEGGRIRLRWKNWGPEEITGEDGGPILGFEKNRLFRFQWHPQGEESPTTVTFTLKAKGNGTVLSVKDEGYMDTREGIEAFGYCAAGWGEALTLLKFYLERGEMY
jgi:uncharacterized protein YndB with AHSA1/START domain